MSLNLDGKIYQWLLQIGIINAKEKVTQIGQKVELSQQTSSEFSSGKRFSQLLDKVANVKVNVKPISSTGVRLYNWNMLSDAMNKVGVAVDNDIKMLIVQEDLEMMNELLKDMMERFRAQTSQSLGSRIQSESRMQGDSRMHVESRMQSESRMQIESPERLSNQPATVKLDDIDPKRPLNQTASLLELLLTSLSNHMKLKSKQAAALLANNNKYLAHMLVAGQKNQFNTVVNWLMDLHANAKQIEFYLVQTTEEIPIFMQAIRPGLISRNSDVATWTLRLFNKMVYELINHDLLKLVYGWFVMENGCLSTTFKCLRRHLEQANLVCQLYGLLAQHNITDFFNLQFRKILNNGYEYIDVINTLWEYLLGNKAIKSDLQNNSLVEYWRESSMKLVENEIKGTVQERMAGIKFIVQSWISYPLTFEQDQPRIQSFLFLLKKATRDRNQTFRYWAFECLFRLLDHLASTRNNHASLLYKKTTFCLIENYHDPELKQFISANLNFILKKYNSIPIETVVIPLTKQILINGEQQLNINISDFELLRTMCLHPKLTVGLAVQMLDVLSKVYLCSIPFAALSFSPIQLILSKFIENEPIQEFSFSLVKVALGRYASTMQGGANKNVAKDPLMVYHSPYSQAAQFLNNDYERKRFLAQQRAQVIELIKFIINLRQFDVNAQIKPILVHFYIELQQTTKAPNKGIIVLLNLLGDPEEMIKEFEVQEKIKLSMKPSTVPKERYETQHEGQMDPLFNEKIHNRSHPTFKIGPPKQQRDDPFWNMPTRNIDVDENKYVPQRKAQPNPMLSAIQLTNDENELLQQFDLI